MDAEVPATAVNNAFCSAPEARGTDLACCCNHCCTLPDHCCNNVSMTATTVCVQSTIEHHNALTV